MLLPRAQGRSYRERKDALAESARTLLPRARKRSYREPESALTESPNVLLPRARRRSYRERPPPLRTSDKQTVRRTRSSTRICSHMRAVSSFAWGKVYPALGIEPISRTSLGKDWGKLEQGGGAYPPGRLQGRRMISLVHSCLWIFGGIISYPGSLSSSLKILGIIPKKQTYKQALQRIYLERTCVHACIQLCTRGYTVVYTRVYSSHLGRRDSLGISTPRT